MRFWLIGMMGSGKTTSGRIAAEKLNVEFMDCDEMIAAKVGSSIAEFWAAEGESSFRDVEETILADLASRHGIAATGGGVVLRESNRDTLRSTGTVIWLKSEPSVLAARLEGSVDRPLIAQSGAELERVLGEILAERSHLYAETADHVLTTDDLGPEAIAARIEQLWRS